MTILEHFFAQFQPVILAGCMVTEISPEIFNVTSGLISIEVDNQNQILPFDGLLQTTLPIYLIVENHTIKPRSSPPELPTPFIALNADGAPRFIDVIKEQLQCLSNQYT